jgi:leader peptidase (prepilin peptidase) / N-methyltransferase
MEIIFAVVLGLCIGSFLNVLIYRLPRGESIIKPGSHCVKCGTGIKPQYLIPVISYLLLKGRCRYCGDRLSWRYPGVELLTAAVFAVLSMKYALQFEFFAYAFLMTILIAVLFIDLEHMIIPDELVIAGLAGGAAVIVYNLFSPMAIYGDTLWWNPLVGMFTGSGILLVVALIGMGIYRSDEAMGMGDVKIFAPIGIFLGWKMALLALLLAVLISGVTSLILILFRIRKLKSAIPFGPFIVIASFIVLVRGWELLTWYMGRL